MKKISILGPESSGKTTLAIGLSKLLKEEYVKEYAREYLKKKQHYLRQRCGLEDEKAKIQN